MRISLCMIVKNEESVLARCLESVKHVVDEIVLVDTGSTVNGGLKMHRSGVRDLTLQTGCC